MILRGNFYSETLEMETGITVVIPNSLKNKKYKIAYLLHGLCGNSNNWVDNSLLPVYANDYNTIFIMPEVMRSFYSNMKYGQKFYTYIVEELPKICKQIFNISCKREDTAIIGSSMGGYGALKCALSHPENYGYCCAFSSPCLFLKKGLDYQRLNENTKEFKELYGERLINDFKAIFGDNLEWKPEYEISYLANKIANNSIVPNIYIWCGSNDYFLKDNRNLIKKLKNLNFNLRYFELKGEHDFYFFDKALKHSLELLYK